MLIEDKEVIRKHRYYTGYGPVLFVESNTNDSAGSLWRKIVLSLYEARATTTHFWLQLYYQGAESHETEYEKVANKENFSKVEINFPNSSRGIEM